jgi:hypothetical protein
MQHRHGTLGCTLQRGEKNSAFTLSPDKSYDGSGGEIESHVPSVQSARMQALREATKRAGIRKKYALVRQARMNADSQSPVIVPSLTPDLSGIHKLQGKVGTRKI